MIQLAGAGQPEEDRPKKTDRSKHHGSRVEHPGAEFHVKQAGLFRPARAVATP